MTVHQQQTNDFNLRVLNVNKRFHTCSGEGVGWWGRGGGAVMFTTSPFTGCQIQMTACWMKKKHFLLRSCNRP